MQNDLLIEHAESTQHRGSITDPSHSSAARNPLCGDQMVLSLRIDDDRIAEIRFEARGCVISQAAASMLCEEVQGKSLDEVRAITQEHILDRIGIPLSPTRRICALLAFQCLQNALRE